MKSKLTLSIDSSLMEKINNRARLNRNINLSNMVEKFLKRQFDDQDVKGDSVVTSMRGILKETPETLNWKEARVKRIMNKHLK